MEIKTNIELLNEISAKLGGKSDASVLVEGLNNIANALGDTDPDQMVTVPQALQTLLAYVEGGGGGGTELRPKITMTVVNPTENDIAIKGTHELKDGVLIANVRHMIKAGESEVIEYYAVGQTGYDSFYDGTGEFVYYTANDIYGVDALNHPYIGEGSNFVNIDDEENSIIDPTKPASFTATLIAD